VNERYYRRVERNESKTLALILGVISCCHFLNDMVQSTLPAIYPILKSTFHLDFGQIGLITLTYQLTASLLQPFVGYYTDKRPTPYSLPTGMGFTLVGILMLSAAPTFTMLLASAAMVGIGSAVFHPESSRVARLASGGQHGLAQSVFQVGGNAGSAVGPLLAAFLVLPKGQPGVAWVAPGALIALALLLFVSSWYKTHSRRPAAKERRDPRITTRRVVISILILIALVFSKYFYMASLTSYYTFYLIQKFAVNVRTSQVYLFIFLGAVAAGTLAGGPIGDRIGRKYVIWGSILGVLPFSLALPYANLFWTGVLTVFIGLILASAFSAILVYATELVPGRVGLIAGLFFGLAFGMGGVGAAVLGELADRTSITFVYQICAFLPAIGLLAAWLPEL